MLGPCSLLHTQAQHVHNFVQALGLFRSNAAQGFRLYAGSPLVASNHEVCHVLRGIPPTDNFSGSLVRCPASAKARHSAPPVSAEICQTCLIYFVHYQHLHISQKLRIGRRITCKNAKKESMSAHDGRPVGNAGRWILVEKGEEFRLRSIKRTSSSLTRAARPDRVQGG